MSEEFELDWPSQEQPKTRWSRPPEAAQPLTAGQEFEVDWASPPDTTKDVAKQIGAGGTLGVGDIVGTPGTAGHLFDMATEAAGAYPAIAATQLLHKIAPEWSKKTFGENFPLTIEGYQAAKKGMNDPALLQGKEPTPEQKGDVNTTLGLPLPTAQGMEKGIKQVLPYTAEEPETTAGKYAHTGARTGVGFTGLGGKEGIVERGATGIVSGLTSEAGGQAAEALNRPDLDPYARFLGGVMGIPVGSVLSSTVRNMALPSELAEKTLMDAMVKDYRNNQMGMTPEQIKAAFDAGERPLVYDMLGPEARAVLVKNGYKTTESAEMAMKLGQAVEQRAKTAGADLSGFIEKEVAGTFLDAPARQAIIKQADKAHVDALYDAMRNDPNAASVWTPKLQALLDGSPSFKKAVQDAQKTSKDINAGLTGTNDPSKLHIGVDQLQYGVKPNLNFLDQVKRNLDDKISNAFDAQKGNEARNLMSLKNQLVGELDNAVSGYATARSAAAESLGARTAIEAGYGSLKNLNAFKSQEVLDAFAKMSPAQQQEFRYGQLSALAEVAADKGPKGILSVFGKKETWDRLESVIGKDQLNQINGNAVAKDLMSKVEVLKQATASQTKNEFGHPTVIGLAGAAAGQILEKGIPQIASMSLPQYATAAVGLVTGLAAKGWYTVQEQRLAPKLMELAASNDPVKLTELSVMLRNNAAARSAWDKTEKGIAATTRNIALSQTPNQADTRPNRKAGGRVMRDAISLANDAVRTRKAIGGKTEQMLSMPDDAIVSALHTAKKTLGGSI